MAPKCSKQSVKKKPANSKPVRSLKRLARCDNRGAAGGPARHDNKGAAGGGNKKRAEKRYKARLQKGLIRESETQWEEIDQCVADRLLQKWLLMRKAAEWDKQASDSPNDADS